MTGYYDALEDARDYADPYPEYVKPDLAGVPLEMTRTHHWRTCPECEGSGSVTFNRSHNNDPQCDEDGQCPNPDCDGGEIVEWIDPLLLLKAARRWARASWGAMRYGELRQEIVSPVPLPTDRARVALERAA